MADEADRHGQQAETLAQQPALLPTWSPLARAVAVYAGCAAVAGLLMLTLVLASGVGLVDGFTLGAWICAGLPALAFFGRVPGARPLGAARHGRRHARPATCRSGS